jgi:hypothetical protein
MTDASARVMRGFGLLLVAAAVGGAAACYRLAATKIGEIVKQAASYDGKSVTVYGTVKERIDLPQLKCYVLDDGSGQIAVATTGPLPRVGETIHTRGRVQASFAIGRRKIVGVIEPPRPKPTRPPQAPPGAALPS